MKPFLGTALNGGELSALQPGRLAPKWETAPRYTLHRRLGAS